MNKKKIGLLFLLFFLFALYKDCMDGNLKEDHTILRDKEEEKELHFILNGEDIFQDYDYALTVSPIFFTKEEADTYFSEAIQEIQTDFQTVQKQLPIEDIYADGKVEADWSFENADCIDSKGNILQEDVPETGVLVYAQVILTCGNYEQIYAFPLQIQKQEPSKEEQLLQSIEKSLEQQMAQEGTNCIELPTEAEGISLQWSEKKEYRTVQVLFLELMAIFLLWWGEKKQAQMEEKKRIQSLEYVYPDLVNQLSMLLETGMTIRQAWAKIGEQYKLKIQLQVMEPSIIYEQIVSMNRKLAEGENERLVYQKFADEIKVPCYYQLMQTLSHHLEKGTADLCMQLEEECRRGYEQKILLAKKMGEETSTKMLIPLMGMMFLVMAIVLLPAILGIKI